MSSSLPSLSGRDVVRAFERLGFAVDRTAGSHQIMKKEGHRFVLSVPVHGSAQVKRGTLKGLIDAAGVDHETFLCAVHNRQPKQREATESLGDAASE